jgi:hypothetical protein
LKTVNTPVKVKLFEYPGKAGCLLILISGGLILRRSAAVKYDEIMSKYIHKAHIVCPAKYRRVVISEEEDKTLKETCKEIRDKIFRDRYRRGSCAFSGTVSADIQSDEDSKDDKK